MYTPEKGKLYRQRNREKIRNRAREHYQKWKIKFRDLVFNHYGKKCVCCGEGHIEFLTIDHINNDGNKHRRELSGSSKAGTWFYKWLMNNNFPNGFQILCWNCNWGKRLGGCPHKK